MSLCLQSNNQYDKMSIWKKIVKFFSIVMTKLFLIKHKVFTRESCPILIKFQKRSMFLMSEILKCGEYLQNTVDTALHSIKRSFSRASFNGKIKRKSILNDKETILKKWTFYSFSLQCWYVWICYITSSLYFIHILCKI